MTMIGFDTEFFNSQEAKMSVVAAVLAFPHATKRYNLLSQTDIDSFKQEMDVIQRRGDTLVAHAAGAEARSLIALGYNPLDFKWIDTYVEFIMLCNSNDKYNFGNYFSNTGDVCFSTPPDPTLTDEEKELDTQDHSEVPKSLVSAVYKLLDVKLDTEQKTEMVKFILEGDVVALNERMEEVLDYCESDTIYLRRLEEALSKALEDEGLFDFREDQLQRGRYSVATSMSENLGIPINLKLLQKVIDNTSGILKSQQGEVNAYFEYFVPETQKPPRTFKNGRVFHYKPQPARKDQGALQTYIGGLEIRDFPRTAKGKYKSDRDTLAEYANKHRYTGGLDYLLRYGILESSLKWFNKDNKNGFFDRFSYVDECVRPYYGIFGTQTGRNAAKAKTFPLAMSSWLRAIVQPKLGSYIIGSDFSQQEVYVAAVLSKDENLLAAYKSGDVYLAFAKQAGLVPSEATKTTHKLERMLCKSTVLGLQFGMGHAKLKIKLKLDSGHEVSDEKTQELIDAHKATYSTYWEWVKSISQDYKNGTPLVTNDGWVLWCDNKVMTSVRNFPVQANAASITRKAIVRCWEMGLKVMCGLHDAIYVISENPEIDQDVLNEIMLWATEQILREEKTTMRIDSKVLSHNEIWVEEKGQQDWDKLKGFFDIEDVRESKAA